MRQVLPTPRHRQWTCDFSDRLLVREELSQIRERLEFERIAGGVQEEHGGLFPHLTCEPGVRFDDECDAGGTNTPSQFAPLRRVEHHPEMWYGHIVAVDGITLARTVPRGGVRLQMRDDLVAEEIEVDPFSRTAAFRAAEHRAVEAARCREIIYGERNVKRSH